MKRICIVVPMFNEEGLAKQSIETILSHTEKLPEETTVVVVNDGSKDSTENIVKGLTEHYGNSKLKLISHRENRGYGAALNTGIQFAIENNYDYVLFMDSDLTNHPRYLQNFYEKMKEGWDYIKATRYSKGGRAEGVPWHHSIISLAGNTLAKILSGLPITDFTNGFRAVKVDILRKMNLKESGFAIIMEELCQAKPLTASFCELPYILTTREKGTTHFSYGLGTCMKYLYYAIQSFFKRTYSLTSRGEAHAKNK